MASSVALVLMKASLPRRQRMDRPRRSPAAVQLVAGVDAADDMFGSLAGCPPRPLEYPVVPDLDDYDVDDAPVAGRPAPASDKTLAVHAGEKLGSGAAAAETDSIATPIVGGTTHWFRDSADLIAFREGRRRSFEYGRYGNPTVKVLEEKISALERAEATLVTSSGMNAIVATLLALVPPGGHVVATADCYSEARAFIRDKLSNMGITVCKVVNTINGSFIKASAWHCLQSDSNNGVRSMDLQSTFVDLDDDMEALESVLDEGEVTMFYADSMTNPHLKVVDVTRVAELCHRRGALVCIDSTLASPINQKPLALGADVVLHSATKYIAGHHDVIAGCVSGSEALVSRIRTWHHDLGGAISPNAAYMIIRGLKTLALRVQAQNRTALRMAQLLEKHPKIERVYYPGLESSPWHGVATRQMAGAGGVVGLEVASDMRGAMRFVDALELPLIATSLGGCESLVQQPAIMSYWGKCDEEKAKNGIKDNFVRFSFGIEKFEDLRDDILQALGKI
ncbi:Os10g0399100 [Oryza sativa Japonica Group]|uniref:Os10g0399100 protein n=2 Tax=Oryza sativa subsp. japonica TaxID=39947 RepID=Q94I45_ORYSJ|nr:Putative O-succinylhomoserine (thiol)-lyase (cystathionine gamma synthase) [Oryza sativa Japonica Group]BAT10727.1 Os10g0399100 [Oryza sativa Japonica Group]